MADSSKKSSYQSLGNGVYRVGGTHRSAVTGRYITTKTTAQKPSSTKNSSGGTYSK